VTATEKKHSEVEAEIARERAAALGRSEVSLRQALEALRRWDAGHSRDGSAHIEERRAKLLREATEACMGYVVHRESMGLTREHIQQLRRECGVPDEVWNRMGVV
jgi:hypothetical protein